MAVSGMSMLGGGNSSNVGTLFIVLEPWKDRKAKNESLDHIMQQVDAAGNNIQEAIVFSVNPPAIPGLGVSGALEMQLLDINNLGPTEIANAIRTIQDETTKYPELKQVTSMYQAEVPQMGLNIDREKAKSYNLTLEQIYATLSAFMGSAYVNDFVKFGRTYQVLLSGGQQSRSNAEEILKLTVRNSDGNMVPFSSFATVEEKPGQSEVQRYNMYTTAAITADVAPHVSSQRGISIMENIVKEKLGQRFSYAWTGEALQETQAGTTITITLLFAVIITILVLAAQYESWTDPVAVVITTPTAILGAIIGCMLFQQSVSIYTQIGIILLLGMAAKNAILIVEYAMDYRKAGQPIRQAAQSAGDVRLRPILMTALAFVFGVMPMLFATGAGANSRIALGCAVVFGMAVNAILGTLFVPGFWELLQQFKEKYLSKVFK